MLFLDLYSFMQNLQTKGCPVEVCLSRKCLLKLLKCLITFPQSRHWCPSDTSRTGKPPQRRKKFSQSSNCIVSIVQGESDFYNVYFFYLKHLFLRIFCNRSNALYVQVFVVLWHVPVPCFLGPHCLSTELAVVDKSIRIVNALHVVPHISPGGRSLVANGAEEKSLVLAIDKLVQLVRVNEACSWQGHWINLRLLL